MAVEIRIMTNPEKPKARKVLRMLAKHTTQQPVVIFWEGQELFRGIGEDLAAWIDKV